MHIKDKDERLKQRKRIKIYRVRWWNISTFILIIAGVAALVVPFRWSKMQDGFAGNVIAGIWGLWIGALVSYVFLKRFRKERFDQSLSRSIDEPLHGLRMICDELISSCFAAPRDAKAAITEERRTILAKNADLIMQKVAFFGRFLELDELCKMELCCGAARSLSQADCLTTDAFFMQDFIGHILVLASNTGGDTTIYEKLLDRYRQWAQEWRELRNKSNEIFQE